MEIRKLKVVPKPGVAYFTLPSDEDCSKAVEILSNATLKKFRLRASKADSHPPPRPQASEQRTAERLKKTASEIACPLAGKPYDEQLAWKQRQSEVVVRNLKKQMIWNGVEEAKRWRVEALLNQVEDANDFKN